MTEYRFEVKVSGWMTRVVQANSIEEARDLAAEVDQTMPIGDLQWKTVEVQDYEE